MNHTHSFDRSVDSVVWDDEREAMVLERKCQERVPVRNPVATGPGSPMHGEEYCEAVQETVYEIKSVVDYHNEHEGTHCVVVRDEGVATTDGAKHISEFDDVPEWVSDVRQQAQDVVAHRSPELFMTALRGSQISITIATSETEYNIVFDKVNERVLE